jgi:hypothetical protein
MILGSKLTWKKSEMKAGKIGNSNSVQKDFFSQCYSYDLSFQSLLALGRILKYTSLQILRLLFGRIQ